MKLKSLAFASIAAAASFAACAATDGALDRVSSVGTFTNTFGTTVPNGRKVQILNLQDAAVTTSTPALPAEGNTTYPGIRDNFCVIDNANGKVRIKFSNTNGSNDWIAKSITGANLTYRIQFAPSPTASLTYVPLNGTVDFTSNVAAANACLTGNVSKGVTANNTIITNVTYVDTVVVTVTPI